MRRVQATAGGRALGILAALATAAAAAVLPAAAVPAFAATSVSGVSVDVAPNTAGATDATYTLGFATSSAGALAAGSGTITIVAPDLTVFPNTASSYAVDGQAPSTVFPAATASNPASTTDNEVTITTPVAIGDSTGVVVSIVGVTNPGASPSAGDTLTVATSADSAPAGSTAYTIAASSSPQTSVVNVSTSISPTTAGDSDSTYTVGFTTSGSGKLAAPVPALGILGGTITLTAPATTVFPTSTSDYTINGSAPSTVKAGSTANIVTLTVSSTIDASSPVTIDVTPDLSASPAQPMTNPTDVGDYTMEVATSADADGVPSDIYSTTPTPTSVSDILVSANPETAGATAGYAVSFDTSSSGALAAGSGTISITQTPYGTAFPTAASDYSVNGTAVTAAPVVATGSNGGGTVTITTPVLVKDSSAVDVSISGATNPGASPPAGDTLQVATSADTAAATSGPYTITSATSGSGATEVSNVSVSVNPPTAKATTATYTVGFITSGSGSLSCTAVGTGGGTITIAAPAGTVFPSSASDYSVGTQGGTAAAPSSVALSNSNATVTITPACGTEPGNSTPTTVTVAKSVTNPATPGTYSLTISTSADTGAVTSPSYEITGPPTVTAVNPNSGPVAGGNAVTITGSGFVNGQTTVAFGTTTTTSFTVASATQIDVSSVPAAKAAGTVNVVVTVGGVSSAQSSADEYTYTTTPGYVPVTPARILDTRTGQGGVSGPVPPGTTEAVQVAGKGGVPTSGATAVAMTVTAVTPNTNGYLSVFPDGSSNQATTSTINYQPHQTTANFVIVKLPSDGKVDFYTANASVNVLFDVMGYFTSASHYAAEAPQRIVDTRNGTGGTTGPLTPGKQYAFPVAGQGGVPTTAVAVAINVTAVDPSTYGNLSVFPDGASAPTATSTINYVPHQDMANLVIVKLPSDGKVDVESTAASVNVIYDVQGYYSAGAHYTPITPTRVLDTRSGSGKTQGLPDPLQPNTTYTFTVSAAGVPAGATAVALNVTAINPSGVGFLTVSPGGATPDATSTVNYVIGQDQADFILVPLPANGKLQLYSGHASVNVAVDVVGYYPSGG